MVEEVEDIKITRRRTRKRVLDGEDIGAGGVDMRKGAVNGGQGVGGVRNMVGSNCRGREEERIRKEQKRERRTFCGLSRITQ